MYQIIAYIKFLFSATNQHGVHSPFIYNFVTKCLYNKEKYNAYSKLNDYRHLLKNSKTVLEITDLGEGSKKLDSKKRSINKMINISSSSKKETELLFRVNNYFNCESILELGTSLGMGTYALALAKEEANITTIEGCPNTSNFSKAQFKAMNVKNTSFIKGDFTTIIPSLKEKTFDLIFFDRVIDFANAHR
jgi:tRNA G46 methylase TrmB